MNISTLAQPVFQRLASFQANYGASAYPRTMLAEGPDGVFFGTTSFGGTNSFGNSVGYGTIFSCTSTGALTTLTSFDRSNGMTPTSLTVGSDGLLYGTTQDGGTPFGAGVFYNLGSNNQIVVLGHFPAFITPNGPPCLGPDGAFYVTSSGGGVYGAGAVYRCLTNGTISLLTSFTGTNGGSPNGGLKLLNDGSMLGCTDSGGTNYPTQNFGTIFRVTTNGAITVLASFANTNGSSPAWPVAICSDQTLYAATHGGGTYNRGTLVAIGADGLVNVLCHFNGTNGSAPFSGVTFGSDGWLYGATGYRLENGALTYGLIYRATTAGNLQTVVRFDGTNGANSAVFFTLGHDGNLYGCASDVTRSPGKDGNTGTFFRLVNPPRIQSLAVNAGNVSLMWNALAGALYQVESTTNLLSTFWSAETLPTPATSNSAAVTLPAPSDQRFFRVVWKN